MIYISKIDSPLGLLYGTSDGESITGLWMNGQKYFCSTLGNDVQEKNLTIFNQLKRWLTIYFSGKEPDFLPKLAPEGSAFRQSVWKLLLTIPYGEVTTYGAIAKSLEKESGKRMSAQAVGGAVGHNPIGIIIPCHRVIGMNGKLTGYAGGLDKKEWLLRLEGVFV